MPIEQDCEVPSDQSWKRDTKCAATRRCFEGGNGITINPDNGEISFTPGEEGDLLFFDGTEWTSLAVGGEGEVLTITGGVPTWAASGGSEVYRKTLWIPAQEMSVTAADGATRATIVANMGAGRDANIEVINITGDALKDIATAGFVLPNSVVSSGTQYLSVQIYWTAGAGVMANFVTAWIVRVANFSDASLLSPVSFTQTFLNQNSTTATGNNDLIVTAFTGEMLAPVASADNQYTRVHIAYRGDVADYFGAVNLIGIRVAYRVDDLNDLA